MKFAAGIALAVLTGFMGGCATERTTTDTMAESAAATPPFSAQDRNFVVQAAQSSQAEIALASLAADKSQSPAVQQFADRMITDHRNANAQLTQAASDEGIVPPQTVAPRHARLHDQLAELSGREFDQRYLSTQVDMHRQAVMLFRRQAESGQSPELRSFARETLPLLEGHLHLAQQLATRAGVSFRE
jgi:putative membrane protein